MVQSVYGFRPTGRRRHRLRSALAERLSGVFRKSGTALANEGADASAADVLPDRGDPMLAPGGFPRKTLREVLAIDHVSHRFGTVTAVDDIVLTVGAGEIVCLVGPSGCGKSTLLRIAAGLESLQQGEVRIDGKIVAGAHGAVPPERRGIGLVFQDYALFPHLSVLDNIRFGLSGRPVEEQHRRAWQALRQVGMEAYGDAYPHALSGGQQQRVALARALAPNPAVLLLDEPFSGLDARLREQVRDETLHVLKQAGAATMLVTHDPEEAMFLADRIALMRDGRLVQIGAPVDLYTRPVNAFAASFFGEVNRLSGIVRGGSVPTPIGPVPGTGFADGSRVNILIRPEALHLSSAHDGEAGSNQARVEASRLLGRSSLVHLSLGDGRGRAIHMHSRMPGQFLPPESSYVTVTLDPRQAFVFAAEDPT